MKFSAYFLEKKGKGVQEKYFEGSSTDDAARQAMAYAKTKNLILSSIWQLAKLTDAGRPIVNKEAKGRLTSSKKGGSYGGSYGKAKTKAA